VESLRATGATVDSVYEEVRRAMVIAGQANMGEGQLARTAYVWFWGARRTQAGRWWLLDADAERVWEVVDGRLRVLAGAGVGAQLPPGDGVKAQEAALDMVPRAVREGPDGSPWLLLNDALYRIAGDDTLVRLWQGDDAMKQHGLGFWLPVDVLPLGAAQALIIGSDRVVAVGGAPEHPLWPSGGPEGYFEIVAADRRPDGTVRVAARHYQGAQPRWKLWRLRPGALPEALPAPAGAHWYGFDEAGSLVTGTEQGELAFHPPDGTPPVRFGAAVTGAWPRELRPLPEAGLGRYPRLRFGGDARSAGWVCCQTRLSTFGPDGSLEDVVAGPGAGVPSTDGPTALSDPGALAMDAAGMLYVVEDGSRVLRVVAGRAEPFAGRATQGSSVPRLVAGDPFAYTLELRDQNGLALGQVPGFGAGYAGAAEEAYLSDPIALRVAADGSLWVLDSTSHGTNGPDGQLLMLAESFVRRVVGGRLETVAVKSSQDRAPWLDMVPTSDGQAVVLSGGQEHVRLLRVRGTEAPVELVRVPYASPPEACEGCQMDGQAPLPGGAWLLRVQGVLWRWEPGKAAVRLGADGIATADTVYDVTMMAASADGKVALADDRRVYRLDPATGKATAVVGRGTANLSGNTPDTSLGNIAGLAVAPNGDLLITDDYTRQVKRVPAAAW
jgi:hypothetical protein